jgi:hypothetical protein
MRTMIIPAGPRVSLRRCSLPFSATCSGSITQWPYGRKGRSPGPRPVAQWRRRAVGRATRKCRRFDHTQPPSLA